MKTMGKLVMLFTIIESILVTVAAINFFLMTDMLIGLAFVLPVIGVMVAETCISISKGFKSVGLGVLNIIYCAKIGGILYLIWKPEQMTVVVEMPQVPEGLPEGNRIEGVAKNSSAKVMVEIKQEEETKDR